MNELRLAYLNANIEDDVDFCVWYEKQTGRELMLGEVEKVRDELSARVVITTSNGVLKSIHANTQVPVKVCGFNEAPSGLTIFVDERGRFVDIVSDMVDWFHNSFGTSIDNIEGFEGCNVQLWTK